MPNSDDDQYQDLNRAGSCCLCDGDFFDFGHNPWPLVPDDDDYSRCCDSCNTSKVLPARLAMLNNILPKRDHTD